MGTDRTAVADSVDRGSDSGGWTGRVVGIFYRVVSKGWPMSDEDLVAIASLLEDDYAREILAATSVEAHSANELAEVCGASPPTIYRRIERLNDHDLLTEAQQLDPDGHHYKVYAANLEKVTVELEAGEYTVEVARTTDPADRFTKLYDELR